MLATVLNLRTARFLLAWFVAFVVVAGIAPAVHAAAGDALCTPAASGNGGKSLPHVHKLECPQCAGIAAPPPRAVLPVPTFAPVAQAVQLAVAAHVADLTGAPLPARGPPAFS